MRRLYLLPLGLACPLVVWGQTAEGLVAKNLAARGGIENIRAIRTLRMTGRLQQGGMMARITRLTSAPNLYRQEFTIQGMTEIQSYDGTKGWQISPFAGRRDPELIGEDGLRGLVEDADFYGPLVDYQKKDNRLEFLGRDIVDGDEAYRLKVTLANGDILYYFLDPDTYLEIRIEKMEFIRGSVNESVTNLGSYKKVAGVYFPFSMEVGSKSQDPSDYVRITIDRMEANVPADVQQFQMPVQKPANSGGKGY